jgi:ribosomal protein L7/L12
MPTAVVSLARAGNMIAAIKEYRSITGAGLAEAKKAVEAIL